MISPSLKIEWVPIQRLYCSPSNPRINDEAVPHVAASIRRFGWQQPIVAKLPGEVIAGNTRLQAAVMLGMKKVPVVWFEGSDLEATAFAIADNRTHEFSKWDEPALAKLIEELQAEDALEGVGFTDEEIDQLLEENRTENEAEVDDPGPDLPPKNPVSRAGDLWILGNHRLLCGDSTKEKDLTRLMKGEKASLLSTDPPYCVEYTGNDRPIHEGKPSGKDWSFLYREIDIKDLGVFLDRVFSACLPHIRLETAVYIWHAHLQQAVVASSFEKHGLLLHQILVWVKPTATFGHCYYRWKHEPCAFGWRKGHKPRRGFGSIETVWEVDWEGKQRVVATSILLKNLFVSLRSPSNNTPRGERSCSNLSVAAGVS